MDFLSNLKKPTTVDRFHLRKVIHAPVTKGRLIVSAERFGNLNPLPIDLGSVVIYCFARAKTLEDYFVNENERKTSFLLIPKILSEYECNMGSVSKVPAYCHETG